MSEWFLNSSIPTFAQAFPVVKEESRFDFWGPGLFFKRPLVRQPQEATAEVARTAKTRTFALPGVNKRRLVQKLAPVHWHDGNEWKDINTDIRDDAGTFVADEVPFTFTLDALGVGFTYVSDAGGTIRVKLTQIGGASFNGGIGYAKTVIGNRVTFADLATGLDIVFEVGRAGVRTLRILKSASAARSWQWQVEYDAQGGGKISSTIRGTDNLPSLQRVGTVTRRELNLSRTDGAPQDIGGGFSRITSDESWTGETKVIDPETHIASWVNEAVYPVEIDPDITEDIADTAKDGLERTTGSNWSDSVVQIGDYYDIGNQNPGFHFTSVAVPASTIDLANLKFRVTGSSGAGYGAGTFYGSDVDNASTAWSSSYRPSGRTQTTASTAFPRPTGTGIHTVAVTAIIQEIVDRGGWASGNDIKLFGIGDDVSNRRSLIEDYVDAGTDEAQLEIDYTEGGGGSAARRMTLLGCG